MSNAYKCDLCQEFFTSKDHMNTEIPIEGIKYDVQSTVITNMTVKKDLCAVCFKDLIVKAAEAN